MSAAKTMFSLFSGGGLADLGCQQAGYQCVHAVECEPAICAVYADNLGDHVLCSPVETVDYRGWAGIDLGWFSPSCKNASVANTEGKESPEDLSAAEAICRCLIEARLRRVVVENVWGYRQYESYRNVQKTLRELGYWTDERHLQAADFGVPQTRKRLILRATLEGPVPPITPTHQKDAHLHGWLFDPSQRWNGWYAAIEDLIPILPESDFATWQLARLPPLFKDTLVSATLGAIGRITSVDAETPAATIMGSAEKLPLKVFLLSHQTTGSDGETTAFLIDGQQIKGAGSVGDLAVREKVPPSLSVISSVWKGVPKAVLVGGANTSIEQAAVGVGVSTESEPTRNVCSNSDRWKAWLDAGRVVAMTPRALARFQTVPDNYRLPDKKQLACRVIGNAVPCLFARRIVESFDQ